MGTTTITDIVYPELTSTEKLEVDGSNFSIWKTKIEFVLFDHNISHVLTDPQPPEPIDDSSKEERESRDKWVKDDRRCRLVMLCAMENLLVGVNDHSTTARSIMDSLTTMYVSTSLPHRMTLFRRYTEHKMSEETPISDHLIHMNLMAIQLNRAGLPVPEEMQVVVLMNSLTDSWETVKRLIMFMKSEEHTLKSVSQKLEIEGEFWVHEQGEETTRKRQRNNEGGFKGNCFFMWGAFIKQWS